jgi:catechol 2,3-dioxygenase-like lactoylglutathione lyase family enzyme
MEYKLTHFGIVCSDIEKSLSFYREQMGSQLTYRAFNRGVNNIAFTGNGSDATLELVGEPFLDYETEHIARQGHSINHISFEVDDADKAYAELTSKGVKVAWKPKDIECVRQCGFYDADDLLFEVYSYPTTTRFATPDLRKPWDPTEPELHHISILTHNLFKAEQFYVEQLGMKRVAHFFNEDKGGFVFLSDPKFNGKDHTFMLELIGPPGPMDDREVPLLKKWNACFDHLCYVADDVKGAWQKAIDKGARKFLEPVDEYGLCLAWVRDPDGNDVEIMSPFTEAQIHTILQRKESINLEK